MLIYGNRPLNDHPFSVRHFVFLLLERVLKQFDFESDQIKSRFFQITSPFASNESFSSITVAILNKYFFVSADFSPVRSFFPLTGSAAIAAEFARATCFARKDRYATTLARLLALNSK